jgi:hypothetical protein
MISSSLSEHELTPRETAIIPAIKNNCIFIKKYLSVRGCRSKAVLPEHIAILTSSKHSVSVFLITRLCMAGKKWRKMGNGM